MSQDINYVFTSGYTARGYHSFLADICQRLQRVFLLKGSPGSGKSTIIRQVGMNMAERGYSVQFWTSPLDARYLDGVYLPQINTAVIVGELNMPDRLPGVAVHNINLSDYWDQAKIRDSAEDIARLSQQLADFLHNVRVNLEEALRARERMHKIYEPALDMSKVEALHDRWVEEILDNKSGENHYFASAVTSSGMVEYYRELTDNCPCRYILEGPPGAYKSWWLYRMAENARLRGYAVSYYHNALDPEFLDMVIIDGLRCAVIDGSFIHGKHKPGDRVIDFTPCFDAGRLDGHELELIQAEKKYAQQLYEAIQFLIKARQAEQKLSKFFTKAMMFDRVDTCREELVNELLSLK